MSSDHKDQLFSGQGYTIIQSFCLTNIYVTLYRFMLLYLDSVSSKQPFVFLIYVTNVRIEAFDSKLEMINCHYDILEVGHPGI